MHAVHFEPPHRLSAAHLKIKTFRVSQTLKVWEGLTHEPR